MSLHLGMGMVLDSSLSGEGEGGGVDLQAGVVGVWTLTANPNDGSPNGLNLTEHGDPITYDSDGAHLTTAGENALTHLANDLFDTGGVDFLIMATVKATNEDNSQDFLMINELVAEVEFNYISSPGPANASLRIGIVGQSEEYPELTVGDSAIDLTTPHTVFCGWRAAVGLFLQVDGGAEATQSYPGGNTTTDGRLFINGYDENDPSSPNDMVIKHLVMWKGDLSALDAAARTWLRTTWDGTYIGLAAYAP